jgi:hypothetical protein
MADRYQKFTLEWERAILFIHVDNEATPETNTFMICRVSSISHERVENKHNNNNNNDDDDMMSGIIIRE